MLIPSYREILKKLKNERWVLERRRGSHKQFSKDGRRITVSGEGNNQPSSGEWNDIRKKAGW